MPPETLVIFLALVATGTLVQTTTGFAMGLVIVGGATTFAVTDVAFTAAVVSLLSLVNTVLALRKNYRHVDVRVLGVISMALVPTLVAGVFLLEVLAATAYAVLERLLGILIMGAGLMLVLQPKPLARPSGTGVTLLAGVVGGVSAGLYSAGGAPLAWFMYKQPRRLEVIRSTLLSFFFVTTALRSVVITATGDMTREVLVTAALAIPLVIVLTLAVTPIAERLPLAVVRRVVFVLLLLMGGSLLVP